MRSVITEISSILFGLSVLIFILALLIPLLKGSSSPAEKSNMVTNELSGTIKNTIVGLKQEHAQSPAIDDELQPSKTQLQGEVMQNQSNGLAESTQAAEASGLSSRDVSNETPIDQKQGESSTTESLQTAPESSTESLQTPSEPIIHQIDDNSSRPVNAIVAEEKPSPQLEASSLLVLGGGFFQPGQVTPSANVQESIDKIIPLIKERSLDNVVVEGHADKWIPDGVSTDQVSKWNKIVSLQRASAVAKLLEQKGVASDRIIVNGLGDAVPLASNLTKEGRMKNRRVEIKLSPVQ